MKFVPVHTGKIAAHSLVPPDACAPGGMSAGFQPVVLPHKRGRTNRLLLASPCPNKFGPGSAGEPSQYLAHKLRGVIWQIIAERLHKKGISSVEISASNSKYDTAIKEAFSDQNLRYVDQWVYRNTQDGRLKTPSGRAISLSIEDIIDTENDSVKVKSTIEQFWGSTKTFSERGLGYIVVESGKTIALCSSGLVDGQIHTVDIQTAKPYRRHGHALSAASHFIADCIAKNYTVHWDCMAANEASWRLAEKLGLERIAEYRCYYFNI